MDGYHPVYIRWSTEFYSISVYEVNVCPDILFGEIKQRNLTVS